MAGGTTVVVTGAGFTAATKVAFGSVSGTVVTVLNDRTLTVRSPAEPAGTYDLKVTAPGGTSVAAAGDKFTVS